MVIYNASPSYGDWWNLPSARVQCVVEKSAHNYGHGLYCRQSHELKNSSPLLYLSDAKHRRSLGDGLTARLARWFRSAISQPTPEDPCLRKTFDTLSLCVSYLTRNGESGVLVANFGVQRNLFTGETPLGITRFQFHASENFIPSCVPAMLPQWRNRRQRQNLP